MLSSLLGHARASLERRARYHRMIREIESLTPRDLADIRGDRATMIRDAYRSVYG